MISDSLHPVPGRAGGQPPGPQRGSLHGLLRHPDPPAPAAWGRDIRHPGAGILDRWDTAPEIETKRVEMIIFSKLVCDW